MRIYFTHQDLARTYLANGPDPMWELVSSLQMLQSRYGQAVFGQWRSRVANRLRRADLAVVVQTHLFTVAPDAPYFPDLLTQPEAALGVEAGIDAVLHTPRPRLAAEIGRLAGAPGAQSWLPDLSAGRARTIAAFGETLSTYYGHAVAPHWDQVQVRVDRDLAIRRQILRNGGIAQLLDSFRPMMCWQHPVLELPEHPSDREVHLDGRGLLLVPSYFVWRHPTTIFAPELPQVVVYPVEHDPGWLASAPQPSGGRALSNLLGDTRAALLHATQGGRSTTNLARHLGVSAATISYHTTILRETGLITSQRLANTMIHTLSPLGTALFRGQQPKERPEDPA